MCLFILKGILFFSDGSRLECEYKNGLPNGSGNFLSSKAIFSESILNKENYFTKMEIIQSVNTKMDKKMEKV